MNTSTVNLEQVPGYFWKEDYEAIERIAATLPMTGKLVEVGSLFGRSIVAWDDIFKSLNKQWELTCIDMWLPNGLTTPLKVEHISAMTGDATKVVNLEWDDDPYKLFLEFTAGRNIRSIRDRVTEQFQWNELVDVVFEDSDHEEQYLRWALPFWWERINDTGMICGHDYCQGFEQHVMKAVDDFAAKVNRTVNVHIGQSSVWAIYK